MILKRFLLSFVLFFYGSVLVAAEAERELARNLAMQQKIGSMTLTGHLSLSELTKQVKALQTNQFTTILTQANADVVASLGHSVGHQNWYQVRTAYEPSETSLDAVLVTYYHDQQQEGFVEAFDEHGQSILLDLETPPHQTVVMLEPTAAFYQAGKNY